MKFRIKKAFCLTVFLLFFSAQIIAAANDSIFRKLAFGKGVTVIYAGSGALKRHLDATLLDADVKAYHKTPAIVLGADHCFYPYASNAYLGIGPFISVWAAQRNFQNENYQGCR